MTETNIDFEPASSKDEVTGLTPEQARATLERLEKVLSEDSPEKKEAEEEPLNEDEARELYEELKSGLNSNGDIELDSPEEVNEETFTDDYIVKAKEALEKVLSEDETPDDTK